MEELNMLTPTELLKICNDIVAKHDSLKQEIINLSYEADELENKIKRKLDELNDLEKKYVTIIEEMNKRNLLM